MSTEQLVKVAKEILKPYERRGTAGDVIKDGTIGGGIALGAYTSGVMHHAPVTFDRAGAKALAGSAKIIGRAGLQGAALGGALGIGVGGIRAAYRGLRGHTSVSNKEYEYRKNQGA